MSVLKTLADNPLGVVLCIAIPSVVIRILYRFLKPWDAAAETKKSQEFLDRYYQEKRARKTPH
jgi:hypothetical protein